MQQLLLVGSKENGTLGGKLRVIVGIVIGVLIGLITGIVGCACVKLIHEASLAHIKSMSWLVTQVLAIPTFWFGGPWLSTDVLKLQEKAVFVVPYTTSLAVTFTILMFYPLYKWIRRLGESLGEDQ